MAKAHSEYDFIFLSVSHGFVKEAVEILRKNNVKGTLVFFCNFWDTRKEVEEWAGDYVYILAFPTAGGQMQDDHLDGVLFDHLMLEGEQKAHISNYTDLTALLTSADLKWEVPHDMVEWIWIHNIPTRAKIFLIMSVLRNMVADTVIKPIGAVTT